MTTLPTLQTVRLTLRPFALTDAPAVQRLAGDPQVARTTKHIPHPYPDGAAEGWITATHESYQRGTNHTFAMTLRETGELIGCMAIGVSAAHRRAELAYWVGVPFWGKGYATEAARAVCAYGFDELKLNRIWAAFLDFNPASGKVMQKLGMQFEGNQRGHVIKDGVVHDLLLYAMTAAEFMR